MTCPFCHEELLPDAFVCRFCGASLPGSFTGNTQRLASEMVKTCPKCASSMEVGFLTSPHPSNDIWWVAGLPDYSFTPKKLHGQQRSMIAVNLYRCQQCGYLEAYAQSDQSQ
jgi:rubrerythrin